MAPIDRAEHRQQRMRGAGITNVQTSFGFNFGGLSRAPKQSSLPPQRSSRRTPVANTPRGANGSAQRHRSASVQRSGASRRSKTPGQEFVTPKLGKRKRGEKHAETLQDNREVDELSPNRDDENDRSIEKSRKVAPSISPIDEELEGIIDELSYLGDLGSSGAKVVGQASPEVHQTPVPAVATGRLATADSRKRTPISARTGSMSTVIPEEIIRPGRNVRSSEPPPITPLDAAGRKKRRSSAAQRGPDFATPRSAPDAEESEDELSPPQAGATPTQTKNKPPKAASQEDEELDELSPVQNKEAMPPSTVESTTLLRDIQPISKPSKGRRHRRVVEDEDEEEEEDDVVQSTPATTKPRRLKSRTPVAEDVPEEEEAIDELSPEVRPARRKQASARANRKAAQVAAHVEESSNEHEEVSDEEMPDPTPRPAPVLKPHAPPKKKQPTKHSSDEPPKKRQKRGPMQAIQVMRLKGFGVKGLTVVDTTRTVVEEWVSHRIKRMTDKLGGLKDATRARELRQQRNIVLAYSEKLDDVLLDLQDANNSGIDNTHKLKQFRKDNKRLLSEYLAIQRDRDQVALQNDEITEEFAQQKKEIEDRHSLSASLYDIQAAIQNGKERALNEGREDEGPEMPIKMLLDNVARGVGPGGLLSHVSSFNGLLDRAAGFLEGRA